MFNIKLMIWTRLRIVRLDTTRKSAKSKSEPELKERDRQSHALFLGFDSIEK